MYAYNWFPRGLVKLGESKWLACWNYLIAQKPQDIGVVYTEAGRHSFWLRGYAENKVKEDRIINNGGVKVIDYSSFKNTVQQAIREISQKSGGSSQGYYRRPWDPVTCKKCGTHYGSWITYCGPCNSGVF